LQYSIVNVRAYGGGGDGREDWVSAYSIALQKVKWRNDTKLIIHLADAPAHGVRFGGDYLLEHESEKLPPLIQRCAKENIKIFGMPIIIRKNYEVFKSFQECQRIYAQREGNLYVIQQFDHNVPNFEEYFKDIMVQAVICAAPKN
jgi:hypothetical protein